MDSGDVKLNWNCEMEVNLLHALRGHKPVGVNRHFQMIFIHDKLSGSYKKITAKQIWAYLGELYDLQALNESEIIPFPNKQMEFDLPENDFSDVISRPFPRLISQSKTKEDMKEEQKHEKPEKEEKSEKHSKSERSDKQDKHDRHHHEKSDSGHKSHKSDSRHSAGSLMNTPDNSPKRKRTRHTPSSNASPATPDAPPAKRRR